jgi:hypothetical protein
MDVFVERGYIYIHRERDSMYIERETERERER